jgi:hypothetical protein
MASGKRMFLLKICIFVTCGVKYIFLTKTFFSLKPLFLGRDCASDGCVSFMSNLINGNTFFTTSINLSRM